MGDEVDARELAQVATGDTRADPGRTVVDEGVAEVAAGSQDTGDAGGDGGTGAGATVGGMALGGVATSFLFADERGPTAPTFAEKGVPEHLAHILDGATDLVLDLFEAGEDVGDSLGPAGKMALGLSGISLDPSAVPGWASGDDGDDDGDDDGGGGPTPPGGGGV